MLQNCQQEKRGGCGSRAYYPDDTIQHAGVVIGFGGIAGHCFVQQKRGTTGYCHRIICAQDYSAVTAACMMVKKEAFDKVGGLTEELAVAFNDIDFCYEAPCSRIPDRVLIHMQNCITTNPNPEDLRTHRKKWHVSTKRSRYLRNAGRIS